MYYLPYSFVFFIIIILIIRFTILSFLILVHTKILASCPIVGPTEQVDSKQQSAAFRYHRIKV